MEQKINIAELLKDCPKGMELNCAMYENLYFDSLNADYYGSINCYTLNNGIKTYIDFTQYGTFNNHAGSKCVIFPKGKTTWEGFVPPCKFNDGDVCYVKTKALFEYIFIFKVSENYDCTPTYVTLSAYELCTDISSVCPADSINEIRLATEEEKQKLFQAIKDNGYKWNAETKSLEKLVEPKFQVGNRIKLKQIGSSRCYVIQSIEFDRYILHNNQFIKFEDEHIYELVSNKFNINTLKAFESKVLVRDTNSENWRGAFYSHYKSKKFYVIVGSYYHQCIPYEGNEHLLDTTDDCDEFYKTW